MDSTWQKPTKQPWSGYDFLDICRDVVLWLDEAIIRSEYANDSSEVLAAMRETRTSITRLLGVF